METLRLERRLFCLLFVFTTLLVRAAIPPAALGETTYRQIKQLYASTPAAQDFFGASVAMGSSDGSGDFIAAVGAPGVDGSKGAVFIFWCDVSNSSCNLKKKLSGAAGGDQFGYSVAMSDDGTIVVVGAPFHDLSDDDNKGAVYVFGRNEGGTDAWGQVTPKLTASGGDPQDNFGRCVAITDNWVAVGVPYGDGAMENTGQAYIFARSDWSEDGIIAASGGAAGDLFGNSVAIFDDRVAVGAVNRANATGAVYLFERSGGVWAEAGPGPFGIGKSDGDDFGTSIAMSESRIVVGAPDANGTKGAVYVFGGATWGLLDTLTAAGGLTSDQFGTSVAINANQILVGAPFATTNFSGAAYLFLPSQSGNTWSQAAQAVAGDNKTNDSFGQSVSLNATYAIAGASGDSDKANSAGAAYTFEKIEVSDNGIYIPIRAQNGKTVIIYLE